MGGAIAAPRITPTSRPTYWASESQKPRREPLARAKMTAPRMTKSRKLNLSEAVPSSVHPQVAAWAADADQGVALGQLGVRDQEGVGLVDDAIDADHAGLAHAAPAFGGQGHAGP